MGGSCIKIPVQFFLKSILSLVQMDFFTFLAFIWYYWIGGGGVGGDRRSLEGVEKVLVRLRANLLVLVNFGAPTNC